MRYFEHKWISWLPVTRKSRAKPNANKTKKEKEKVNTLEHLQSTLEVRTNIGSSMPTPNQQVTVWN